MSLFGFLVLIFSVSWHGECVKDSRQRLLPTLVKVPSLTPAKCMAACQENGLFSFAGVQTWRECWCGREAPPENKIVAMKECKHNCQGDSSIKCGGPWRMRVFKMQGLIDLEFSSRTSFYKNTLSASLL